MRTKRFIVVAVIALGSLAARSAPAAATPQTNIDTGPIKDLLSKICGGTLQFTPLNGIRLCAPTP
jgi:hypothetical protein